MNAEKVNTWLSLGANFGVVIGLFLLVVEIGQNTDMMRANASSEWVQRDYEIVAPFITSRELAEIWMKGGAELESLDAVDKQRLMFFERRAIILWHHLFQLRAQNLIEDAVWHEQTWVIRNIGRRQAIREAWRIFKDAYEASFQEFIDEQFEIADIAGAKG